MAHMEGLGDLRYKSCMVLSTLNLGKHGDIVCQSHAGFLVSTVVSKGFRV